MHTLLEFFKVSIFLAQSVTRWLKSACLRLLCPRIFDQIFVIGYQVLNPMTSPSNSADQGHLLRSWIGSVQSFLFLTTGLFAGHLFDKGYLSVSLELVIPQWKTNWQIESYHLVYTGSVLWSLSLFLLSFAKPENYYQVRNFWLDCGR